MQPKIRQFKFEVQQLGSFWRGTHKDILMLSKTIRNPHELLRTKGLPIGLFPPEEATYRETQQYIPFDSQLYIFSDGVYENTQATSSQDNWDANSNLKCNT